jgi:hypothetical protein
VKVLRGVALRIAMSLKVNDCPFPKLNAAGRGLAPGGRPILGVGNGAAAPVLLLHGLYCGSRRNGGCCYCRPFLGAVMEESCVSGIPGPLLL